MNNLIKRNGHNPFRPCSPKQCSLIQLMLLSSGSILQCSSAGAQVGVPVSLPTAPEQRKDWRKVMYSTEPFSVSGLFASPSG